MSMTRLLRALPTDLCWQVRAQQAAYRAAMPFPADIGRDIEDVRSHVVRLLQPVGYASTRAIVRTLIALRAASSTMCKWTDLI
jgi:hypothetical protein